MKKAALAFTFLVLIIVSLVGAGTFTKFIYDQAGLGKLRTDNLVSYVNDSLDAKENRYKAMASYSLIAGDVNFLRQLNKSLIHAASRVHTAKDQPCIWRFPSTDTLDTKNLFLNIFPLDTTSTGGEKGIRVQTLVGQQVKDYYNIPDIGVCVVGGEDAFEKEISQNWVDYFTKGEGEKGDTYLRTPATLFINTGDDHDENYIQFEKVGYYETCPCFDFSQDWFKSDNYLGVQSGNWLYSPGEGLVCFVSVYDFMTEDIHEAGFDFSQMLKYFDNHFGDIVPYGSMDDTEFLYIFDGGVIITELYYLWEEGIGWKWSPDLENWMSVDTNVVSGGFWNNQIPAQVNMDLIKELKDKNPDPRVDELPSVLRHQLNDPAEVHRHDYGTNTIEVCRG